MPAFFIKTENIKDEKVLLSGALLNHLKNALRYNLNDEINLIDEHKTSYRAIITKVADQYLEGTLIDKKINPLPVICLILAFPFIKRKKMELILQKGTELGVSEFVPLITERTMIHPREDRLDHQMERWQKILLESAQQSEQSSPPLLHLPADFKSFIKQNKNGTGLIFWEKETRPLKNVISDFSRMDSLTPITMVIGPEGGFHENEVAMAIEDGYFSVSLGKQKLRSETAIIAAITLLQYELGYFG